jgi:hypothetical protein
VALDEDVPQDTTCRPDEWPQPRVIRREHGIACPFDTTDHSRAGTAAGRSDSLAESARFLSTTILIKDHDGRRVNSDPTGRESQFVNLPQQLLRIEITPGRKHAENVREDCGGREMQQNSLSAASCLGRVAGVRSAHAHRSACDPGFRNVLSNLALAFGTKLSADDDACRHAPIVRREAALGDLRRSASVKDQYVGDVNDFYKYALLRELAPAHNGRLIVAWMRTPGDGTGDGRHLAYLQRPNIFRRIDPNLFDALQEIVRHQARTVAAVEERGIVPASAFHSEPIADNAAKRTEWFAGLGRILKPGDLVFFDPDNGLAVRSVPPGRKNSAKYLYWSELAEALQDERSVCIYQHFGRRARDAHLKELADRIGGVRAGIEIAAVTTPRVAFLLAGTRDRLDVLRDAAWRLVARAQCNMVLVQLHPRPGDAEAP